MDHMAVMAEVEDIIMMSPVMVMTAMEDIEEDVQVINIRISHSTHSSQAIRHTIATHSTLHMDTDKELLLKKERTNSLVEFVLFNLLSSLRYRKQVMKMQLQH